MPPTPLDGKPLPCDSPIDRRRYFADWLTAPDNPYFARALVNRVWRNFLGRGLVEAEDDLRQTNPPTNAELFDALAKDFVDHQYDVKHLIRTIMNSATYQRSVEAPGRKRGRRSLLLALPDSPPAGRGASRRLFPGDRRADAVHAAAYGRLRRASRPTAAIPLGTRTCSCPIRRWRRQFLDAFGRPDANADLLLRTAAGFQRQPGLAPEQRPDAQRQAARQEVAAWRQWLKEKIGDEEAIRRLFLLALCREPPADELKKFQTVLAEAAKEPGTTRREVLEDLFWAVLTGREFLFNH